ncbi:type VI secretion system-associated FHA domain protein TagH [Vibrio albus]|nr:type VI secretion system-associated FHA domain protein TagH [Vibrio albus]
MKARIKVVSYKSQPPESPVEVDIGESGGTLGRAPGNTCVLPDPDRFISGKHAAVTFENGKFIITDTSTNGLYFEGNLNPLGRDHSAELIDGQRLVLGDYTLEIAIEDEPPTVGHSPFGAPVQSGTDDPFAAKPTAKDDFFTEPVEQSIPPWQPEEPAPSSSPSQGKNDFFSSPSEREPRQGTSSSENNDFFSPDNGLTSGPGADELTGSSMPDNVPSENQFFRAPDSIPEDWDILSDNEAEHTTPETEPTTPPAEPPTAPEPGPEPQTPPQNFAIPNPGASSPPRTQAPANSGGPSNAFASFVKGAGIEHLNIPESGAEASMETSGALLRGAIEGLMQMLRARADVKSEFRMQQTTIRAVENNPLKFSVSADDALQQMLQPTSSAYLPAHEALSEALDDIEAHQLAIMAGVQAALSTMLQRFDPDTLKRHFDQKSGRSLLESKKAWYWEQYEEQYQAILSEAEDSFQELFGEAFSKAYEEQVEKLSVSRKKR